MTSAFSKTFVFRSNWYERRSFSKVYNLEGVFESLRFRVSRYPFSIVLVWTIGDNVYKSNMRLQTKSNQCGRGLNVFHGNLNNMVPRFFATKMSKLRVTPALYTWDILVLLLLDFNKLYNITLQFDFYTLISEACIVDANIIYSRPVFLY